MTAGEQIAVGLRETKPLKHALGRQSQLYVWPAGNLQGDNAEIDRDLRSLTDRGIAAYSLWTPGTGQQSSLVRSLRLGAMQKRMGPRANVSATDCAKTWVPVQPSREHTGRFRFTNWEIDMPIGWNEGWNAARKCVRRREHIPDVDNFESFQKAYRAVRSEIQREFYNGVVLKSYPNAPVGNYGVYPNDGRRYWYDYCETEPGEGVSVLNDQRAKYRPWVSEF